MFRINRRTDYAVRVMVCLARHAPGMRLPTQVIQSEMRIPPRLLRRIIADLARVGLVNTFAGPRGGLELSFPAGTIRLRHIWEAIEGPLLITDCLEGVQACPLETGCPVNRHWLRLQARIVRELDSITLKELAAEAGGLPEGLYLRAASRISALLEI